jgi:RND family efflux transporter MFP subunit
MILLVSALITDHAFAHGGEDHAAPAAPPAAADSSASIATWSSEFEAVLRLPYEPTGEPVHGTLLLADYATSAPIAAGTATIGLARSTERIEVEVRAGERPGIWPFDVVLPGDGVYGGDLTVITPDRSDLLGLPEFTMAPPPSAEDNTGGWGWMGVGMAGGLVVGLALGALVGFGGASLRKVLGVALVAVLVATTGRVFAHGGEDHGAPPARASSAATGNTLRLPLEAQFLLEVRTARSLFGPFDERIRALGTTIAPPGGSAEIHSPVTGILALPEGPTLAPGQVVAAGQPLALISETLPGADRSSVAAGQSQAQIRLAEARRDLAVAERDAARAEELGGVLSERDRMERKTALEVARQAVVQAEAEISAFPSGTPTTVLRAPIRGRISAMSARPGDVVSPGEVLFRIVGSGGVWVEARLPEALAARFVAGAPAVLHADARPDEAIEATVLDPGLEADPATGTLRVTLAAGETPSWLVPGMTVVASIVSGEVREALIVPEAAIVDSAGETLVFVKTGPESFEMRPVRVGALSADRREILAGLHTGDRVVEQGTYTLRSLAGR